MSETADSTHSLSVKNINNPRGSICIDILDDSKKNMAKAGMSQTVETAQSLSVKNINNTWGSKCIDMLDDLEKNIAKTDLNQNKTDLLKTKLQAESKLKEIKEEIKSLERKISELDTGTEVVTKKRSVLALYQHITKLRWDLESPENHLKGFVAGDPFKVFDIDLTKHSEQEIVDKLWALIDPQS